MTHPRSAAGSPFRGRPLASANLNFTTGGLAIVTLVMVPVMLVAEVMLAASVPGPVGPEGPVEPAGPVAPAGPVLPLQAVSRTLSSNAPMAPARRRGNLAIPFAYDIHPSPGVIWAKTLCPYGSSGELRCVKLTWRAGEFCTKPHGAQAAAWVAS